LDTLLRWFWLEMGDPLDPIPQGCLAAVLKELCHPIEVVPQGGICAGMDPGYLLYALARSQDPAMDQAARLLLGYASETGLFNEYYIYPGGRITPHPNGGKLRFWESAVNGWALIHYLLGLRLDLANRQIFIQPHLPPGWPGWISREIPLAGEGTLQLRLERSPDGPVSLSLIRRGGAHSLKVNAEFGASGPRLVPLSGGLEPVPGRPDLLRGTIVLRPVSGHGWFGGMAKGRFVFRRQAS
jgi:hypothetical protein